MNRAVGDAELVTVVERSVKSEYAVGHICKTALTVFLVCISVSAQSAPIHSRSFRVHGTIRAFTGSVVPRAEVTFKGEQITKTVSSDSRGMYGAELPVGAYTMTASWTGVEKYRRPLFRVESARAITLNITFYSDAPSCDPVFPRLASPDGTPKTPAPTQDDYSDVCGGRDYLPIPSEPDLTFDLLIQYSGRQRADGKKTYVGYDPRGPVFVAYNLFSLEADKVIFDVKTRTIAATGNVVTADGSGKVQHFDSISFRVEDGHAIALEGSGTQARDTDTIDLKNGNLHMRIPVLVAANRGAIWEPVRFGGLFCSRREGEEIFPFSRSATAVPCPAAVPVAGVGCA